MLLKTKVLLGHGIALALMGLALVWALLNLVGLGRAGEAILRENYASILAAQNMTVALERQDSAALLLVVNDRDEALRQFHENQAGFLQWLGRAKSNITIAGEEDVVRSIESCYTDYVLSFHSLSDLPADPTAGRRFYHQEMLTHFRQVRDQCAELLRMNQETMFAASARAETVAGRAFWSTVAVTTGALFLGVGFSLVFSRRLVRPIDEMTRAAKSLAEGDYAVQVPVSRGDELGRLAQDFNTMAARLGAYHRLNVGKIVAGKQKSDAVLRSIDDGIVVVDSEFRITEMNPPAGRILGVEPESVHDRHFLEVVKDDRLFALVQQAAGSGQTPVVEEEGKVLSLGSGEHIRHYLFGITPVLSESATMLGVVLVLRDITRMKDLERRKSEFVMAASHELKTPLQSLVMSVDLLQESAESRLTDKEKQLLTAGREELQRLKSLINDLLELSSIQSGTVGMDFERVPVAVLVDKVVVVFKNQAEQKKVDLGHDLPEGLPEVRADANKITWVLSNLVSNALRYVHADGHVRLGAERVGEWVHLWVCDDGEGIPPEVQSRVFDKFVEVRGDASAGTGSGLGLAICREIVRAHKGTIWVESGPGKGSTFTFTLPVWTESGEKT